MNGAVRNTPYERLKLYHLMCPALPKHSSIYRAMLHERTLTLPVGYLGYVLLNKYSVMYAIELWKTATILSPYRSIKYLVQKSLMLLRDSMLGQNDLSTLHETLTDDLHFYVGEIADTLPFYAWCIAEATRKTLLSFIGGTPFDSAASQTIESSVSYSTNADLPIQKVDVPFLIALACTYSKSKLQLANYIDKETMKFNLPLSGSADENSFWHWWMNTAIPKAYRNRNDTIITHLYL